jgi:hypothetical protein
MIVNIVPSFAERLARVPRAFIARGLRARSTLLARALTSSALRPPEGDRGDVSLLVTAWHLDHMRSMPRALWHVRALDRHTRGAPSLTWMHRWLSRRSVALTSTWRSRADAEAWLASPEFARRAAALEAAGARLRIERAILDPTPEG